MSYLVPLPRIKKVFLFNYSKGGEREGVDIDDDVEDDLLSTT